MKKQKKEFLFLKEFVHSGLNIEIERWTIVDKKKVIGKTVKILGNGIDGKTYDGIANILETGEIKSVKVDINSGRWE